MFDPGLNIGQVVENADVVEIFKCGNSGGMRRSKKTNTLVLISDYTKGIYHDKWIGGVLHYTGMGKKGDQDIQWAQNQTLADNGRNGVDVHLFEVIDPTEYIYCGRIELASTPYMDTQPDEDGMDREVCIFPIRPVPDNDVIKPPMYVFENREDYLKRGKNVDAEYLKAKKDKKRRGTSGTLVTRAVELKVETKKKIEIPSDIVGKKVSHRKYGVGTISKIQGNSVIVDFDEVGLKKLDYETCVKKKLFELLDRS